MAKWKLLSQHFSEEDKLLEPGTEVGDGTPHRWTRPPTVEMEPLDDKARELSKKERERAGEIIDPLNDLPMSMDPNEVPGQARRGRQLVKPTPEEGA